MCIYIHTRYNVVDIINTTEYTAVNKEYHHYEFVTWDSVSCCISRGRHVVAVLSVQYPRTLEEADVYWSSVTSCQAQKKKVSVLGWLVKGGRDGVSMVTMKTSCYRY